MRPFFPWDEYLLIAIGLLAVLFFFIGAWQLLGTGPRTRRRIRAARRLLDHGDWQGALKIVRHTNKHQAGSKSQNRLLNVEGKCLKAAAKYHLEEGDFEAAFKSAGQGATLLNKDPQAAQDRVIDAMLATIRRRFAEGQSIGDLVTRVLVLTKVCREASFWLGLAYLRDNKPDVALSMLETARTGHGGITWTFDQFTESNDGRVDFKPAKDPNSYIDPSLYIGAILLRQKRPKDALRYLTEANRIDGQCPFVRSQLGTALIAADGDTNFAIRALERALGSRGFGMWIKHPQRAWTEGMPERRSYVRRLAMEHEFACPLWGKEAKGLIVQARTALGAGYQRLGDYQQAAKIFDRILQETAPSLPVVRGLGLSLARLGEYDRAFKHLRIAQDLADSDRLTAGYLALCGAKGTPSQEAEKARNVAWAIQLVGRFTAPGDQEWADLVSAIFAEARGIELQLRRDDQIYLCEHLLSVDAFDPTAADAFHHLQATSPNDMRLEYAWLYVWAAHQHRLTHPHGLELYAIAFSDRPGAESFFAERGWSLADVELDFLTQAAERQPGRFPEILGPDYPQQGEERLLRRAAELQESEQIGEALAVMQTLVRLAPASGSAHDRLAFLYHRLGHVDEVVRVLSDWHAIEPGSALPLVRLAVVQHQSERFDEAMRCIVRALDTSEGRRRGEVAFVGARLALARFFAQQRKNGSTNGDTFDAADRARALLDVCLAEIPDHLDAWWCSAALLWIRGERTALARHAQAMDRDNVDHANFQFLAAVSHFAGANYPATLAACERVAMQTAGFQDEADATGESSLHVESAYLAGWAHLLQGDRVDAIKSLTLTATSERSPSASCAKALAGRAAFEEDHLEEAIQWWKSLQPEQREHWKIAETLAGTLFLYAVRDITEGRYEVAAERIREAGRSGWRDRRLGQLLTYALIKAGQELLYPSS